LICQGFLDFLGSLRANQYQLFLPRSVENPVETPVVVRTECSTKRPFPLMAEIVEKPDAFHDGDGGPGFSAIDGAPRTETPASFPRLLFAVERVAAPSALQSGQLADRGGPQLGSLLGLPFPLRLYLGLGEQRLWPDAAARAGDEP
jgi:hypothetical protein